MVAALALVGSCSSSSDGAEPEAEGPGAEAGFDVEALGALAVPEGSVESQSFDQSGGELDLTEGATLQVPEGAFGEATEVTAETFELAFADYLDGAPSGALYVVSTEGEVDLSEPVMLEVPKPSEGVRVIQHVDGEWTPVDVAPGETTVVPIDHFSTVSTAVVDVLPDDAAATDETVDGDNDGQFLRTCILAVNAMFGGESDDDSQAAFAGNLAFSVCTRALIDRNTPNGERVSVACVGDQIGDDTSLDQAIEACLEGDDADEPDGEPTGSDSEDGESGGSFDAKIVEFASQNGLEVDSVLTNEVTLDLTGDVPEIEVIYEVRLVPDNYADDSSVVCQSDLRVEVDRSQLAGAAESGDEWTGRVPASVGGFDGTCPAGSTDNAMLSGAEFEVVITTSGGSVSGSLEADGDVLTFEG